MAASDFAEIRNQCIESLLLCADNVSKYVDTGKEVELNNLRKCLESYCISEVQQNAEAMVLNQVKSSQDIDTSNINQLYDNVSKQLMQITQQSGITGHPLISELEKRIEKNNRIITQNVDDSDLTVTETENKGIDPLTKKPIENPVRNENCNHVYERDIILSYIKRKNGAKCPVVGCVVQQPLKIGNLISEE